MAASAPTSAGSAPAPAPGTAPAIPVSDPVVDNLDRAAQRRYIVRSPVYPTKLTSQRAREAELLRLDLGALMDGGAPLSADLPLARLNAQAAAKDDSILAARKGHPRGSRAGSDADMAVDGAAPSPDTPTTIAIDAAHALDLVIAQHADSDPSRLTPPALLRIATNASAPPKPAVRTLVQVSRAPPYYSPNGLTARQSAFLAEGARCSLLSR